jgi:hypothetical protein
MIRCAPAVLIGLTGGTAVMELLLLLFFVVIAIAGASGLVADSRDFADWRPTNDGFRDPRRGG